VGALHVVCDYFSFLFLEDLDQIVFDILYIPIVLCSDENHVNDRAYISAIMHKIIGSRVAIVIGIQFSVRNCRPIKYGNSISHWLE